MYLFPEGIECSGWDRWTCVCNIQNLTSHFPTIFLLDLVRNLSTPRPRQSRCLENNLIPSLCLDFRWSLQCKPQTPYESNQAKIIHSPKTNLLFLSPLRQQRTSLLRNSLSRNTLSLPILSLLPNSPRNTHPQQTSLQHPRTQIRKPSRPICPRSNCNAICKQKRPRRLNTHHWNG